MGKNFSANNLGQRRKSDFYETPYSMTLQLMEIEMFDKTKTILEPSCGEGAITKVLKYYGYNVTGKDISLGNDFLKEDQKYDMIMTNPPFSLALEFILKAKELCDKIVLLLPLSYLHGKERYDKIYNDTYFPLSRIYVFTRYPLLGEKLRSDGKYNTGMMVYGWFIWDKKHVGEPVIRWIDNNQYILKRGE